MTEAPEQTFDVGQCPVPECGQIAESTSVTSECGCTQTKCVCLVGHLVYVVVRMPGCYVYVPPPGQVPPAPPTFGSKP